MGAKPGEAAAQVCLSSNSKKGRSEAMKKGNGIFRGVGLGSAGLAWVGLMLLGAVEGSGQAAEGPQGQATNEVETWKAEIKAHSGQIQALQDEVLGLKTVFRDETKNLRNAQAKFREDPNANRKQLQTTTVDALMGVRNATGEVLERQEEALNAALEIERTARTQAANYRAEGEKLDQQLPAQQARLAELRGESDEFKENFADNPTDRQLKRRLWSQYRQERREMMQIDFNQKRMGVLNGLAMKLDTTADTMADVYDVLDESFGSIEDLRFQCQSQAELLKEILQFEDVYDAFTGDVDMRELLVQAATISEMTGELNAAIHEAMDGLATTIPGDVAGGSLQPMDAGFERWLNQRSE